MEKNTTLTDIKHNNCILLWNKIANDAALKAALLTNKAWNRHVHGTQLDHLNKDTYSTAYRVKTNTWNNTHELQTLNCHRQRALLKKCKDKLNARRETHERNKRYRERMKLIKRMRSRTGQGQDRLSTAENTISKEILFLTQVTATCPDDEKQRHEDSPSPCRASSTQLETGFRRYKGLSQKQDTFQNKETLEAINKLLELENSIRSLEKEYCKAQQEGSKYSHTSTGLHQTALATKEGSWVLPSLKERSVASSTQSKKGALPRNYVKAKLIYSNQRTPGNATKSKSISEHTDQRGLKSWNERLEKHEQEVMSKLDLRRGGRNTGTKGK